MATREDICIPRKKKDGGTYWVKIGTCWNNDGKRQLVFDALPLPDAEGRCVANLFEPRETDGGARRQSADADRADARGRSISADLDDEIPPF